MKFNDRIGSEQINAGPADKLSAIMKIAFLFEGEKTLAPSSDKI